MQPLPMPSPTLPCFLTPHIYTLGYNHAKLFAVPTRARKFLPPCL